MRLVRGLFVVVTLALSAPGPTAASSPRQVRAEVMTPTQVVVPRVIGMQLNRALRLLDSLKFSRGDIRREPHPEPTNQVIDQLPRAEAQVPIGTRVNLTVSEGPQPDSSMVPDLFGQNRFGVALILAIAHLSVGKTQTVPDEEHDGKVVRQFPEAGAKVPRNSPVDLWLGRTPPVPVPDLRDSTIAGAAEVLKAVGLRLGRVDSTLVESGIRRIVRQRPGAQTNASKGSAVRVWYGYPRPGGLVPPPPPPAAPPPLERVRVPSVVDSTLAGATALLVAAGLTPGPVESVEVEFPPFHVRVQKPRAGDSVPRNTRVALQVAVQSRLVKVPNVTGSTPAEARNTLERVGLRLGAVAEVPLQGGTGRVIFQAPLAGATVLRGSDVAVRVSQPLPPVTVPSVVGRSLSSAREALDGAGLAVGTVTPGAPTNADSTVAAQNPEAGAVVLSRTPVDLTLSTESVQPPPRSVPNVVGRSRTAAESILRGAGFRTGAIGSVPSTTVGRDTVISQSPAAGTPVPSGTEVSLQVAAPPPPNTVPNVVGLSTAAAESILLNSGLGATRASEPSGPGQRGLVLRQDPPAGTVAPTRTIVLLTIGQWPPVWLIVVGVGGTLAVIVAGIAGVQGWKQHKVNKEWQKRVRLEAGSLPGQQAVRDDAAPPDGPEFSMSANPGEGSQEVVGDGPILGESRT